MQARLPHGWIVGILILGAVLFALLPGLDLWVSGLFFEPGRGFPANDWLVVKCVYRAVPFLTDLILYGVIAFLLITLVARHPRTDALRRPALFLLLAALAGPVLTVNSALKNHWGRPRPVSVVEFGGAKTFQPWYQASDQCRRNCAFVSGHASFGYWWVVFAFVFPRRARLWLFAGVMLGAAIGLTRIAQGGHFASDVFFAFYAVWYPALLVHRYFPPWPQNPGG